MCRLLHVVAALNVKMAAPQLIWEVVKVRCTSSSFAAAVAAQLSVRLTACSLAQHQPISVSQEVCCNREQQLFEGTC
jgi:hypothetical protein